MNTYVFCENDIDEYEKTILSLAISFAISPVFSLKDEDILGLANFLQVNVALLKRALSFPGDRINEFTIVKFGEDKVNCSQLWDNTFFVCLFRVYYIYENINKLKSGIDYDDIRFNKELFWGIVHQFDMLHAAMTTFECMYKEGFSYNYTVFDNGDFRPMDFINALQLYLSCEDSMQFNKSFISVIYLIFRYEIHTRIKTLHLIVIAQIFKHSSFLKEEEKIIASELYDYLLFILKNGRVISIQTNLLYVTENVIEQRRRTENTTRMQIIYGYGNYDTYVLRLDLAHIGEEYIHWNNKSPGGLKSCIFNDDEYQTVIKIYPEMEACFIQYDTRWALKERRNCEFSEVSKIVYESVRSEKEHEADFYDSEERLIISFVQMISRMLPIKCNVVIDIEETHAQACFNLDKIMSWVYILYLSLLSELDDGYIQKILNITIDRAIDYGIINKDEKSQFLSIEGVCLIVEGVMEKANF